MSSEFFEAMGEAFEACHAEFGTTLTHNGITVSALATPRMESKALRDSGYLPEVETTAEIRTKDCETLAIVDRSEVTLGSDSTVLIVLMIERDDADPCVRLHLKRKL